MQKTFLILPLLCIFLSPDDNTTTATVTGRDKFAGSERTFSYTLGNKSVTLKRIAYGRSKNIVMINLHSDETTGIEAAISVLERTGGTLLSIENNYQRNITFSQRGRTYKFDPNRIFTKKGIKATLLEQNQHSTNSAISSIHGFSTEAGTLQSNVLFPFSFSPKTRTSPVIWRNTSFTRGVRHSSFLRLYRIPSGNTENCSFCFSAYPPESHVAASFDA